MTATELKALIKSGRLDSWMILAGEEDYLKNYYRTELKKLAVADENDPFALFNYTSFDGDEFNIAAFRDSLISPPMMADYKLVEWRHADLDKMKESDKAALLSLAENRDDYPYARVIITTLTDGFDTGTEKKRSKLYTRLSEHFDISVFDKSTDAQLIVWLKRHFAKEGVMADDRVLSAMLFRVGHSMFMLNEEVTKLSSYAKANGLSAITVEDVEEICSSSSESDAFAISNAILEKNAEKAFLALNDMKQQRIEPPVVLGQLARTYSDLLSVSMLADEGLGSDDIAEIMKFHPYRLKLYMAAAKKTGTKKLADALDRLIKIDAASKMGGVRGYKSVEMFIAQNI